MSALAALAVAAGLLASGDAVLGLLSARRLPAGLRVASAAVLGACLAILCLQLTLLLTGRLVFLPLALVQGLALLTGLAHLPWSRLVRAQAWPSWTLPALGLAVLCAGVLCARPLYSYDAKAIYGLKAKALLHERTLDGALWQDPDVVHYHADYPLGVPLLMAYTGWLAGPSGAPLPEDEAAPSTEAWLAAHDAVEAYALLDLFWAAAFLALLAGWLGQIGVILSGRWAWCLLATPLALIGPVDLGASWRATPELPLALCLAVVLAHLLRGPGWSAGLVAGLAALTAALLKQDAVLGLASMGLALVVAGPRPRAWGRLAALAGGLALGLVLNRLTLTDTAGAPYDEHYLQALLTGDPLTWLGRLPQIPPAAAEALWHGRALGFWVFVLLVALPLGLRGGPARRLAAVALAVHLLLCLAIFVVTPNVVTWHVRTALLRVWTQMAGAASLLALTAWVDLWMGRGRPAGLAQRAPEEPSPAG